MQMVLAVHEDGVSKHQYSYQPKLLRSIDQVLYKRDMKRIFLPNQHRSIITANSALVCILQLICFTCFATGNSVLADLVLRAFTGNKLGEKFLL